MVRSKRIEAAAKKGIASATTNVASNKQKNKTSSSSSNNNSLPAFMDKDSYNGNTPGTEFVKPDIPVSQKAKRNPTDIEERCCNTNCKITVQYTNSQQHVCGNTGNIIHGFCTAPEMIEKYGSKTLSNWCISCYSPWSALGNVATDPSEGNYFSKHN